MAENADKFRSFAINKQNIAQLKKHSEQIENAINQIFMIVPMPYERMKRVVGITVADLIDDPTDQYKMEENKWRVDALFYQEIILILTAVYSPPAEISNTTAIFGGQQHSSLDKIIIDMISVDKSAASFKRFLKKNLALIPKDLRNKYVVEITLDNGKSLEISHDSVEIVSNDSPIGQDSAYAILILPEDDQKLDKLDNFLKQQLSKRIKK
jgi:hypothetical protein